MPAPRPADIASKLSAYARLLRGMSSAAATPAIIAIAMPSGRAMVCDATSNGNDRCRGAERAEQRRQPGEQNDGSPTPDAIGQHRKRQRDQHADAHGGTAVALALSVDAEAVGREVRRLREQRVGECGRTRLRSPAAPGVRTCRSLRWSGGDHHDCAASSGCVACELRGASAARRASRTKGRCSR